MRHSLDLSPIKERLSKITPFPWETRFAPERRPLSLYVVASSPYIFEVICRLYGPQKRFNNPGQVDNQTFIVNAPQDISDLVAEVEALRAELAKASNRGEP